MLKVDGHEIYKTLKYNRPKFDEEKHCSLILNVMANPMKGRLSAFCAEAFVSEATFYTWLRENELFFECYSLSKMLARENWEHEGAIIAEEICMPGTSNHRFEHWRMVGWSRFGVGKNSRIRLDLDPKATPNEHYSQLLYQASQGDFTAGEIKQLMEAVNVGLNTHQVIALQKEIDQLRSDLATMNENTNAHNSGSDTRIEKED